jgi:adenine-specific DNA-methyltransferase
MVMNEVFGEENWIETFVWKRSYGGGAKEKYAVSQHEYILLYARTKENIPGLWLPPDPEMERRYYKYKDENFETRGPYRLQPLEAAQSLDRRENLTFAIPLPWGGEVWPKRQWLWAKVRVDRALRGESDDALEFTRNGDEITVSYKQYLRDKNGNVRGAKPFSVIDGIYTQQGTADLTTLLGDPPVLQFPKPVALMKRLLSTGTESDQGDTVLDFFAGSCTMAQAVLELNREDGGGRRFVMVQLPEPTSPDSPARTAGYTTIAEIGKERIRRVIQRMKEVDESQLDLSTRSTPEDLGFRAYKLTSSNYKPWMAPGSDGMIPPPESYATQMELLADPLAAGWDPMNVIWEVALKEGYSLNSRIEHVENISGNTVYRLTDPDREQSFLICLDNQLDASSIKELGLGKEDTFICRDVALTDDLAANLALQCRLKSI